MWYASVIIHWRKEYLDCQLICNSAFTRMIVVQIWIHKRLSIPRSWPIKGPVDSKCYLSVCFRWCTCWKYIYAGTLKIAKRVWYLLLFSKRDCIDLGGSLGWSTSSTKSTIVSALTVSQFAWRPLGWLSQYLEWFNHFQPAPASSDSGTFCLTAVNWGLQQKLYWSCDLELIYCSESHGAPVSWCPR